MLSVLGMNGKTKDECYLHVFSGDPLNRVVGFEHGRQGAPVAFSHYDDEFAFPLGEATIDTVGRHF